MINIEKNGHNISVIDDSVTINKVQDILDLMATEIFLNNSGALVINKESLSEDFFDLKTRFAGDVLQKFSNYNMKLAIVGDFSVYKSKALHEFIYECNKGTMIFWVESLDKAIEVLF